MSMNATLDYTRALISLTKPAGFKSCAATNFVASLLLSEMLALTVSTMSPSRRGGVR
jgi:hypothetical protein